MDKVQKAVWTVLDELHGMGWFNRGHFKVNASKYRKWRQKYLKIKGVDKRGLTTEFQW